MQVVPKFRSGSDCAPDRKVLITAASRALILIAATTALLSLIENSFLIQTFRRFDLILYYPGGTR